MSDGFVKLYGDRLLRSTVWACTDPATKVAWITLLAMADETGAVYGSIPGLAKFAGITLEQAIAALDYFASPDPHSQSPEYEGRRIESVEGGWRILNYGKYREYRTRKQAQAAKRVARHRAAKRGSVTGNAGNADGTPVTAASASASDAVDTGCGDTDKGTPKPRASRASRSLGEVIAEARRRYTSEQLAVIDTAIAGFASTRKGNKVRDGVVAAEYRWWASFPAEQVVAGLQTYVDKRYALDGKAEKYARGIIRRTDPVDADDAPDDAPADPYQGWRDATYEGEAG